MCFAGGIYGYQTFLVLYSRKVVPKMLISVLQEFISTQNDLPGALRQLPPQGVDFCLSTIRRNSQKDRRDRQMRGRETLKMFISVL